MLFPFALVKQDVGEIRVADEGIGADVGHLELSRETTVRPTSGRV